jgi:tripartite-type tricarboxylate transporter receptor subunit TctC
MEVNVTCKKLLGICIVSLLFCYASDVVKPAAAQSFYKDKNKLTMIINFGSGGPTEVEARLVARFLPRHIEGHPSIVLAIREGAGGVIGTTYIGEVAPRDGTVFGYLTAAAWSSVMEPKRYRVNFRDFEMIAYKPDVSVYYVRADAPPGIRIPSDLMKAKKIVAGGQQIESVKDLCHRLTLDMLEVSYQYVTWYNTGAAAARLAVQRGEIDYYSEGPASYFSAVEPNLVKTGLVVPLFYDPAYNGGNLAVPRSMARLSNKPFHEFYKSVKGADPSGPLWDAYVTVQAVNQDLQRVIVMAPGVPSAAVAELRQAMRALNDDQEFQEQSRKLFGFGLQYEVYDDINHRVRASLALMKPETRAFIDQYVGQVRR